jgi:CRISPR/Cas system CMR subunit Cmr4 (Cas7 group RAMP superfamily)
MLTDHGLLNIPASEDKLYTDESISTNENESAVYLEDDNLSRENYTSLLHAVAESLSAFNTRFAYVGNKKFDNYAKDLPVIARNRLDKNKNLWYEEVVPHQTIFITYILSGANNFVSFEKHLLKDFIQVGANSSVGYGLCKFHKIDFPNSNVIK